MGMPTINDPGRIIKLYHTAPQTHVPKVMNYLHYILNSIPLVIALVIWAVRLEKKITRIETDIAWLKKELPACRQSLEDLTP